jgi:hypothetical protein
LFETNLLVRNRFNDSINSSAVSSRVVVSLVPEGREDPRYIISRFLKAQWAQGEDSFDAVMQLRL